MDFQCKFIAITLEAWKVASVFDNDSRWLHVQRLANVSLGVNWHRKSLKFWETLSPRMASPTTCLPLPFVRALICGPVHFFIYECHSKNLTICRHVVTGNYRALLCWKLHGVSLDVDNFLEPKKSSSEHATSYKFQLECRRECCRIFFFGIFFENR